MAVLITSVLWSAAASKNWSPASRRTVSEFWNYFIMPVLSKHTTQDFGATLEKVWYCILFSEYSVILVCDATGATIDVRCDYSKTIGTTYTEQASSHMSISQSVSEEITVVRDRNWLVYKTTQDFLFLGRIVQPVQYGPWGVVCDRTRLDLHFRRDNELGRNDSSLSYCPCRENPLYWTGIILFTTIHHSINHPRPPF